MTGVPTQRWSRPSVEFEKNLENLSGSIKKKNRWEMGKKSKTTESASPFQPQDQAGE